MINLYNMPAGTIYLSLMGNKITIPAKDNKKEKHQDRRLRLLIVCDTEAFPESTVSQRSIGYSTVIFVLLILGCGNSYVETHKVPRVPQCLSPRPKQDPSPASEFALLGTKWEGTHSPAGEGAGGPPNSDDWRKSLVLCLLCERHYWPVVCIFFIVYIAHPLSHINRFTATPRKD